MNKMQKTFNRYDLKRMLRISDPFLLIDIVDNIVPKKSGIGLKFLKNDEWFFASHFTDQPVMPGTLQTECMLQTIIAVLLSATPSEKNKYLIVKSSVLNLVNLLQVTNVRSQFLTRLS